MVKTLTDKFKIGKKNRGKKLGLLGAALFNLGTFIGCPSPVDYEKPNPSESESPKVSLTISPTSGTVPLESVLSLNSSDANGDVSKSYIFADYDGDGNIDSGEELTLVNSGSINQNYTFTKSGTFNVYGQCEDKKGNVGISSPVTITVQPNPDATYVISGQLQDNETDTNKFGEVRLFVDGVEKVVDSDGNDFSFEVQSNSNVKLKGKLRDGSYTRTLNLGNVNEDKTGIDLRCVPYAALGNGSLDVNGREADFKEHMKRVNFDAGINQLGTLNVLKKWNYGELPTQIGRPILQGIEIDPDNWTDGTPQDIVNRIRESKYLPTTSMNIKIGKEHINEEGWIRIAYKNPNDDINVPYTKIYDGGSQGDGYISKVEIYLNTTSADVVDHETVHGLGQAGHADNNILGGELFPSLMVYTNSKSPAKEVDIKASYIVDEPTYSGMESIEDILE